MIPPGTYRCGPCCTAGTAINGLRIFNRLRIFLSKNEYVKFSESRSIVEKKEEQGRVNNHEISLVVLLDFQTCKYLSRKLDVRDFDSKVE